MVFFKFIQTHSGYHPRKHPTAWQHEAADSPPLCGQHQPFCRVGCSIPHTSRSVSLPSARKPQPPCRATALAPTKFFPFFHQGADFFQLWLRGIPGPQVLVPRQTGPRVLPAVGDEFLPAPGSPGAAGWLSRKGRCSGPGSKKCKFPVSSPSQQ